MDKCVWNNLLDDESSLSSLLFPPFEAYLYQTRPRSHIHGRFNLRVMKIHSVPLQNSIHLITPASILPHPHNLTKPLPLHRPLPPPPRPSLHLHAPHHAHYAPNPHPSPPAPKRLLFRPLHARLQIAHLGPKPHRYPRRPHRLHHHSSFTHCRRTPAHRSVLDNHGARMDEHRRPPHG